ncbi:hypothetical protein [Kitasatospora sp. NPDC050543]|uniref:hypothetical protein n=1 Tax=Kitasatospora sp. NPDC050543 TaxID=3364054 RepID=UPI0037952485
MLTRITRAARSDAYEALAGLGRADSRMALSASECAELEELAGQWLAHGATIQHFTTALTAGLPQTVHCPGALARKRLVAKMPPAPLLGLREAEGPRRERILECADCGRPGRPETMPQGSCRDCREGRANPGSPHPDREGIRVRVEQLRAAMQRGRGTFGEDRPIPPFGE